MVLSFSSAAEAMMFSVGWQAVEMTTSVERRGGQTPRGDTGKQGAGAFTCVALQFLHDLLRLQVPDVHHVVLGARHDPLQDTGLAPRTQKTVPPHAEAALTFPPVTEKLANMQYFSFLWPV